MNALFIRNLSRYISGPHRMQTATKILEAKIASQRRLLLRYGISVPHDSSFCAKTMNDLLLFEARYAQNYWKMYRKLLNGKAMFPKRDHTGRDPVNTLLNIGYHYLRIRVSAACKKYDISPALGIMHVAHSAKAEPLVYDIMELFRVIAVDAVILHYFRLKKKQVAVITPRDIAAVIFRIKKELAKKYFNANRRQCISLEYYIEMNVLRLISAVNHSVIFVPLLPPQRHDDRCGRIGNLKQKNRHGVA